MRQVIYLRELLEIRKKLYTRNMILKKSARCELPGGFSGIEDLSVTKPSQSENTSESEMHSDSEK